MKCQGVKLDPHGLRQPYVSRVGGREGLRQARGCGKSRLFWELMLRQLIPATPEATAEINVASGVSPL